MVVVLPAVRAGAALKQSFNLNAATLAEKENCSVK